MRVDESTSLIATYTDQEGAELLAKFIKSANLPCEVTIADSPGLAAFHVCTATAALGEIRRAIELTQVAQYDDPMSAQVVAGRLISEDVPVVLGGRRTLDDLGFLGRYSGPYTLLVPKRFLDEAKRVLDEAAISDSELTELALRTAPEADDSK